MVMRTRHGRGNVPVYRITGARTGLQEDVRGRQRRYVISMSVRTVSVLLAVGLWNVQRVVAIAAFVIGMVMPYIAVVIANAGRENAPKLPSTFVSMPPKPMLTGPRTPDEGPGTEEGTADGPREHTDRTGRGAAAGARRDGRDDPAAHTASGAREPGERA
ncbi:hypothetical protein GCM10010512_05500 [Streptomyces thermoviolaceus subsp. thermoviolaceus]|nr:hypothetical protein GCM10010499_45900 [Streptomyces thermoviolaceus subsp. apingens]GHA77989.1 hypothetical protein GCM10010512_05500 [Streptomyces thermoviolaceus subsp. thermoviolaceus]